MRKETTLGLTLGGIAVVVAVIGYGAVSHKNTKGHGVATTLMPDVNGSAGDDASGRTADDAVKPDERPARIPDVKPAPVKPANVQVAKADAPKDDAFRNLLFGRDPHPLIGNSTTPDPRADNATANTATVDTGERTPPPAAPTDTNLTSPPTTPPATQPTTGGKGHTHVVQKGETFSTIAAAAYGSANFYPYIMRANPQIDAKALKPNMTIKLPDVSEVKPTEKAADPKDATKPEAVTATHKTVVAIDATKEYKVAPGDSLHRIAIKLYGKIDMVSKIYEANRAAIGENPAALKVGMVLRLPQPPVSGAVAATH